MTVRSGDYQDSYPCPFKKYSSTAVGWQKYNACWARDKALSLP